MSSDQPQPRPQQPTSSHSRTSSFFSSFRKQSSASSDLPIPSPQNANGHSDIASPPRQSLQADLAPQQHQQESQQHKQQLQRQPSQPQQSQEPPPLHPEIRSIVQLTVAHAHKVYFSGPLVRRIEREANGNRPAKDDGWVEVWAQLGGTTLSVWDMKQIQEASQQGKEVPPTYINMMDAFVQVLGSVTVPATPSTPAQRYTNVLTLNTAGSNLILFACQSTQALISWAAALRLSAWEKSRLEEIYTAHLIRITLNSRDIPTTLVRGRLEGWVRVRIAGQTDWKLVWMVINAGTDTTPDELGRISSNGSAPGHTSGRPTTIKRMSNLFGREHSPQRNAGPSKSMITMYAGQKPKDRKKPLLTMFDVSQAFAVYPERPELITRSTLIKVEGTFGHEETAGSMGNREGWLLLMPQLEGNLSPAAEMLKWIIALHDAFKLYGRPQAWTWDPRDPISLMFAYPVGPHKDLLFLEREQAETLDPRDDHTSGIRSSLLGILTNRMKDLHGPQQQQQPQQSPRRGSNDGPRPVLGNPSGDLRPMLPPLSFDSDRPGENRDRELLTPITERSSINTHGRGNSLEANSMLAKPNTSPVPEEPSPMSIHDEHRNILNQPFSTSPTSGSRSLEPDTHSHANILPTTPEKDARFSPLSGRRSQESGSFSRAGPSSISKSSLSRGSSDNFSNAVHTAPPPSAPMSSQEVTGPVTSPRSVLSSPFSLADSGRGPMDRNDSFSHAVHTALPPSAPMSPQESPGRPHSPGSVLTSPFSIADDTERSSIMTARSISESQNQNQSNQSTNSSIGLSYANSPVPGTQVTPTKDRDRASILTSPYSPISSPKQPASIFSVSGRASSDDHGLSNEAGALFYMQQQFDGKAVSSSPPRPRRMPTTIAEDDDSDEDVKPRDRATSPGGSSSMFSKDTTSTKSPILRQSTPMAFTNVPNSRSSPVPEDRVNPSPSRNLGRKPSGARAPTNSRSGEVASNNLSSQKLPEEDSEATDDDDDDMEDGPASATSPAAIARPPPRPVDDDDSLDAYAAFSYLDINDNAQSPVTSTNQAPPAPKIAASAPLPPKADDPAVYKSSFAPSKSAAERKAKAQAQQAAQAAAANRPGRANGGKKRPVSTSAGRWGESSDEEEEEEEEEEEDEVDSDVEPQSKQTSGQNSSSNSIKPHGDNMNEDLQQGGEQFSHLRPPRTLPLPPGGRGTADGDEHAPRRPTQFLEQPRRTYLDDGTPVRTQAEHPMPGAARQNMWSQVLDPGHTPGALPERDTFVQLEPPSQTMTKAFTPQGLLSAGMQDRQDRSAKRQEELARETGASLINVPNKPPPPQTGLLGAVSAHERERKREGGIGAALTEREREKRVAEERQRKFDEQQRQQMEQMQQGGSMYGQYPGFNPMMMGMNPMMMGMNPMMTGVGMMNPMMTGNGMQGGLAPMMTGYSGMMPGYNPQHMIAAQHAAQAYQQAMMAFSVAGSQAGGEGPNGGSPNGSGSPPMNNPMNPMMTGSMYDPRMSMMPMMGMGPMGGMNGGMGMQMTGMSQFDPRFTSQGGSPSGVNDPNSLLPPSGNFGSGNSSPARNGSPLARPPTTGEGVRSSSRPTSPKP